LLLIKRRVRCGGVAFVHVLVHANLPCAVLNILSGKYRFHPADHPADQTHFDAVRVIGRISENVLNRPCGQVPGSLILFLNHLHPGSRFDLRSFSPVRHYQPRKKIP
jgi:hypothetical protein